MRFQGSFDLPRGKTLCIVFIAQIEWVAKIGFLIGNDLETSEVLIFATSCIKSKECFIYVQRYNFFSKFNVHIIKIGEMYY